MKKIVKGINILLSILLVFIAIGIAYIAIPKFGNQALIVRSGSMSPTINLGSVVVARQVKEDLISPIYETIPFYNSGDIIAFRSEKNSNNIITHRVVGVQPLNQGGIYYQTKGDANEEADGWIVNQENILGKVYFGIPYVGHLLAFAKSDLGFPLLIIFPAFVVIILELITIVKEVRKKRKENFDVPYIKLTRESFFDRFKIRGINAYGFKILMPILFGVIIIPGTLAFFSDSETSTGNVFQAAEVFPPQTDHLVISEVQTTGGSGQDRHKDFVEIYNPTADAINLEDYRLVKKTGAATPSEVQLYDFDNSDIIPAHGFFLWASTESPGFATSISADVSSSQILATTNNSVALKKTVGDTEEIVDALSWSSITGSFTEGTRFTPDLDANESMERKALSTSTQATMEGGVDALKGNGFDSNNNSTDFILRTVSQPQNSSSATESP